jgi:alpha-L-fucosidase
LLYTDGAMPFGNDVGRSMIAHLYNTDLKNRGSQQVVYCCKEVSKGRWIEDLERGVMAKINPDPWQTDTSIGDWYYNKNWKFRPVSWVITMLADIVAKNGNLLLNVVQRPDGSLDPEVETMLEQIAAWNAVNGEAIFDTRPWLVYGEGAVKFKGGNFKEDFNYSSQDVRFTTKGGKLYAIALGWPGNGEITLRSLAKPEGENINQIQKIRMLGSPEQIQFKQGTNGLTIRFPSAKPCEVAYTLEITGTDLKPVELPAPTAIVQPDARGNYTLSPDDAGLDGDLKSEEKGGRSNIGYWDKASDSASWKVNFAKPGVYKVTTACASPDDSEIVLEAAGQKLAGKVTSTGGYETFQPLDLGTIKISKAGEETFKVRPSDQATWKPINLRAIQLVLQQAN